MNIHQTHPSVDTITNEIIQLKITGNSNITINQLLRVAQLRAHLSQLTTNHEQVILGLNSLHAAHVYCIINHISAQQFGPLLEKYILTKFNYHKNNAKDCNGDCIKNGVNTEIKVSLGGSTHTKFNFVQLRPSHTCDSYIFTAYHLSADNVDSEGELYIFRLSKPELKQIIVSYGSYAHGTMKEHGLITSESIDTLGSKKEYAIRPTFNDACWKSLLSYRIYETDL